MPFILGKKLEMSQEFKEDGSVVAVTLVEAQPNVVTQVRTQDKDGYSAVQLGVGETKKGLNKPAKGHLKDLPQVKTLREFRVEETELERGSKIDLSGFEPGMKIDVTGVSKGRGFQGVVKRHGFKGSPASHGHKDQLRMPGSIGSHDQGPVIPGTRMGGRMGGQQVTVKNLEVASVDQKKNILAIKGAVPGSRGQLLMIKTCETKNVWQS